MDDRLFSVIKLSFVIYSMYLFVAAFSFDYSESKVADLEESLSVAEEQRNEALERFNSDLLDLLDFL